MPSDWERKSWSLTALGVRSQVVPGLIAFIVVENETVIL